MGASSFQLGNGHKRNCTANAGLECSCGFDKPRQVGESNLPKAPGHRNPVCPGCGVDVEREGDVCAFCEMLPRFQGVNEAPPARLELAPQKEPPYLREGNYRRERGEELEPDRPEQPGTTED